MVDEQTKNLLSSLGLITLYPKLHEQSVGFNAILSAGDPDLIRLGVSVPLVIESDLEMHTEELL